jgi:hypothetical protein
MVIWSILSAAVPVLAPAAVVAAWIALGRQRRGRREFVTFWLVALLASVTLGWLAGAVDPDSTRRGLAIAFSSTSWLLGPVLLPLLGRVHALAGVFVGACAAPAGALLGLIAAIATGVINPCG